MCLCVPTGGLGSGEVKGDRGVGHVELQRKKGVQGEGVGAGVGTAKGTCKLLL